jgi:hypothetical protein
MELLVISCLTLALSAAEQAAPGARPPGWFGVTDFGAVGDGTADCTTAFQQALDAAGQADGGVVWVPAGNYRVQHLNVPSKVTLRGIFEAPPRQAQGGSVILAVPPQTGEEGEPFLMMHECSALRGLTIHYPDQRDTEDPIPYPWCIRGRGDNVTLTDVLLSNPYNGIDFGTFPTGRHYLRNVNMQALRRGLFIDKCFDVGRVENVHVWPFWSTGGPVREFSRKQGEAFIIGRTDWEYLRDCFCIGYAFGWHFIHTADGDPNCVLDQCGSDVGPVAVQVDACQGHAGLSFVNGQIMATVRVAETNTGPVKFTNCGFWPIGTTERQADLAGQGTVTFNGCHFAGWDNPDRGEPCIFANCTGLMVTGCDFMKAGPPQIVLGEGVESAVIAMNRLRGGAKIENRSQGDVQIGLNSEK